MAIFPGSFLWILGCPPAGTSASDFNGIFIPRTVADSRGWGQTENMAAVGLPVFPADDREREKALPSSHRKG